MRQVNSTRVRAPDINQPRFPQGLVSQMLDDATSLKPIGRDDDPPTAGGAPYIWPYRSPIRRAAVDNPDWKRAFLNAKSGIGKGTWNVRTLHQSENVEL